VHKQPLPKKNLDNILNSTDKLDGLFSCRLTVEAIKPDFDKDITSIVKIQNTKTNEVRDVKGSLKKDEQYILYLQLYVQDYSNYAS
jgi:hypothetical protein